MKPVKPLTPAQVQFFYKSLNDEPRTPAPVSAKQIARGNTRRRIEDIEAQKRIEAECFGYE